MYDYLSYGYLPYTYTKTAGVGSAILQNPTLQAYGQQLRTMWQAAPKDLVAGGALAAGGLGLNTLAGLKLYKTVSGPDTAEDRKLSALLKAKARKQGIKVVPAQHPLLSYYQNVNDTITTGKKADIFAHEYGHSQHYHGRDSSLIGRIAHRLSTPGKAIMGSALTPIGIGILAGGKAASALAAGKAVPRWTKALIAAPAAASIPVLTAEAAASLRGMKELRELGASDEYLRNSRRNLLNAWSTYLGAGVMTTGLGLGAKGFMRYKGIKI